MQQLDLNLLLSLDALLREQSVTAAAERLNLSISATSRALMRARKMIGDPLLVRAGKQLAPTPRALELRPRIHALVEEAHALAKSQASVSLANLQRTFTIRTEESFVGTFASRISEMVWNQTPGVTLRFINRPDENVEALREGMVDLDIGVIRIKSPELKIQMLFRDKYVGMVRLGHPLLAGKVTAKKFAEFQHISASRRGKGYGPVDEELRKLGLQRRVSLIVPTFYAALAAAADSEMVATLPRWLSKLAQSFFGMTTFALPVPTPSVTISQAWHPRLDSDSAHRYLRECIRALFRQTQ